MSFISEQDQAKTVFQEEILPTVAHLSLMSQVYCLISSMENSSIAFLFFPEPILLGY